MELEIVLPKCFRYDQKYFKWLILQFPDIGTISAPLPAIGIKLWGQTLKKYLYDLKGRALEFTDIKREQIDTC